jgi:hypothetical protein
MPCSRFQWKRWHTYLQGAVHAMQGPYSIYFYINMPLRHATTRSGHASSAQEASEADGGSHSSARGRRAHARAGH